MFPMRGGLETEEEGWVGWDDADQMDVAKQARLVC